MGFIKIGDKWTHASNLNPDILDQISCPNCGAANYRHELKMFGCWQCGYIETKHIELHKETYAK